MASIPEEQAALRGQERARHGGPAWRHLRQVFAESLVRNAAFLTTNVGVGLVVGVGTLTLLTRLYSVRAVGLSAAAIAATSLVTSVSQLGLNYSLLRFLPESKRRSDLINSVLTVTMVVAMVGAGIFLALPSAAKLYALGGAVFAGLFVISTGLAGAKAQLQNVFIADRAAGALLRANMIAGLIGVAGPAVFLFLGAMGAYIARGVVPATVDTGILVVMLMRRGQRFRPMVSAEATRGIRKFSGGSYIADVIGSLPLMLLPLIILSRFGATENAYWYTAMAGATLLRSLPGSVSQALLAEAVHRPEARRALVRKAALLITAVMIPAVVIAYVLAPLGLALLGHHYETGSLVTLRLLILAAGLSCVNYLAGTILYLAKWTFAIAAINVINTIIVLGLAVSWADGASGVAWAWMIGEIAYVAMFCSCTVLALQKVHWRWDKLGADGSGPRQFPVYPYGSPEAQLAGLEMLMSLATQTRRPPATGRGKASAPAPLPRK
jgi:O-antigen/teichoic acid export membrane protein